MASCASGSIMSQQWLLRTDDAFNLTDWKELPHFWGRKNMRHRINFIAVPTITSRLNDVTRGRRGSQVGNLMVHNLRYFPLKGSWSPPKDDEFLLSWGAEGTTTKKEVMKEDDAFSLKMMRERTEHPDKKPQDETETRRVGPRLSSDYVDQKTLNHLQYIYSLPND